MKLRESHVGVSAAVVLPGKQAYEASSIYLLVLLLAVLAVWRAVRRRIQRVKGSMGIILEERNRISRECHDTLMAGFAAVSWQLEATAKMFREGDPGAAESFELARSMVSLCQAEARRIIWDLRDADEVTSSLTTALTRMLEVHPVDEHATTTLEVRGQEVALAPGSVHHLSCIGQEAMNNALRHAKSKRVTILLRYEDESLHLTIRDDGQGFMRAEKDEAKRGHFGIAVMEERARKLGGTLKLESAPGAGTEVTVSVPFERLEQPMRREQDVVRWIGI